MATRVNYVTNTPSGTSFPPILVDGNNIAAGSTKTLVVADHRGTVKLDTAAQAVVTLPAATGSGTKFRFVVTVLATTNSHIVKVASATDFFVGIIHTGLSGTPGTQSAFPAANSGTVATNSDTITLNRSTTGSVIIGEWFEVEDIATATWHVRGDLIGTATIGTPFSATV